jgi:hypothetical protein
MYTLSLHDAIPIYTKNQCKPRGHQEEYHGPTKPAYKLA